MSMNKSTLEQLEPATEQTNFEIHNPNIGGEEKLLIHKFVDELIDDQLSEVFEEEQQNCLLLDNQTNQLATEGKQGGGIFYICKNFILLIAATNHKYESLMMKMLTFVILFFTLINVIRYTLLSAKSVIIKEALPPLPFFPYSSNKTLQDFYDGWIDEPGVLRARAEFTIVMLYAPWDFRSKQFRRSFLKVAKSFYNLNSVRFIAVNCHYHRGKCRKNFKLLSYPVIFAHTPLGQPIVFNEVLSSDRLFNWILHLLSPLKIVHSIDDHHMLIRRTDFAVFASFALQHSKLPSLPHQFNVFLNAAYKATNSRSSLAFGIVQNQKLYSALGFDLPNEVHFHTFYENESTQIVSSFRIGNQTNTQELLNWVNECIGKYQTKAVYELDLEDMENAGKLDVLYQKLNSSSATVVLFTSVFGLHEQSHSLIELKNIAKIFNNCQNDQFESFEATTLNKYLNNSIKICSIRQSQINECCDRMECTTSVGTDVSTREFENDEHCCSHLSPIFPCGDHRQRAHRIGDYIALSFPIEIFKRRCCKLRRGKSKKNENGSLAINHIKINWRQQMACKFAKLMRKEEDDGTIFNEAYENKQEYDILDDSMQKINGAGCKLNRTIGFMVVDKKHGHHFMRKWRWANLSSTTIPADSVAFISQSSEQIFWMNNHQPINSHSLAKFLLDFLGGNLVEAESNQIFGEHMNDHEEQAEEKEHAESLSNYSQMSSSILDSLNHELFVEEILNGERRTYDAVVIFTCGDWHSPSTSVMHILHQTKKYFHEFNEYIHFYEIDTTKNSLPWAYKFGWLPIVAFFPAKSPHESSIFPTELAFTVPNLLGFILPKCQEQLRWRLTFTLCKRECLANNIQRIGMAQRKMEESIGWLRKMIRRKITIIGLQNMKIHLRRHQLRRAVLIQLGRLATNLLSWQQMHPKPLAEEKHLLQQNAAKEAELLTWFLLVSG